MKAETLCSEKWQIIPDNKPESVYESIRNKILESGIIERKSLKVEKISVGVFYTGILLSDGSLGITCSCAEELAIRGNHLPTEEVESLTEQPIRELMSFALNPLPVKRVIGATLLNALGYSLMTDRIKEYNIIKDKKTLQLMNIQKENRITLVGAFASFVDQLYNQLRVSQLTVIDNNPRLDQCMGCPVIRGGDSYKAIPLSDKVILTGVTFSNGTLDSLLDIITPRQKVALVGPSIGLYPDVFFSRGVYLVGSILIKDPERVLRIISHGGSNHVFKKYIEKVHVINPAII